MAYYKQNASFISANSDLTHRIWLSAGKLHLDFRPLTAETADGLRVAGVCGMLNSHRICAFKELLSPLTVQRVSSTISIFFETLLGKDRMDVMALEHLRTLPDNHITN